jgi:hypothetical protein
MLQDVGKLEPGQGAHLEVFHLSSFGHVADVLSRHLPAGGKLLYG